MDYMYRKDFGGKWKIFRQNSLALILSSTHFNADDYIYDYEQFKKVFKG